MGTGLSVSFLYIIGVNPEIIRGMLYAYHCPTGIRKVTKSIIFTLYNRQSNQVYI